MADLAEELRKVVALQEFGGWQRYARPGVFTPLGVIVHHTGGQNDLNVVINGRPDLDGPLSNLYLDRDPPYRVTLVSGGRCNHAGAGSQLVLEQTRRDIAPVGDARARSLPDGPTGNPWFYGLECENLGTGQGWPAGQLAAIVACCATLCRLHGWSSSRVIGHREWTRRKPDPFGLSMADLRSLVAQALRPAPPPAPPNRTEYPEDAMMVRHDLRSPLDQQGNGYIDAPLRPESIVSIVPNGDDPSGPVGDAGYKPIPVFSRLAWAAGTRIVVKGGSPLGAVDFSVWTVE